MRMHRRASWSLRTRAHWPRRRRPVRRPRDLLETALVCSSTWAVVELRLFETLSVVAPEPVRRPLSVRGRYVPAAARSDSDEKAWYYDG